MKPSRRTLLGSAAVLGVVCAGAAGWAVRQDAGARAVSAARSTGRARHLSAPAGASRRWVRLGRSVEHRPIEALELRAPDARRTALVVGCVHGDETAGIRVARALERTRPLPGVDLWILPDLNPDGVVAGTRQNARRVDLNRNFPWRWRALGRPGDQQYPGARALSEPESRIARRLILRLRPRTTVWFHQPLGVTDESGGDIAVERRFAAAGGLPLRRLPRYPGSATSWQDHRRPGSTAFVAELPAGRPSRSALARYVRAVRATVAPRAGA